MTQGQYAIDRTRAAVGVESRVQTLLFSAARRIVALSSKHRRGSRVVAEAGFLREARDITAALTDSVEAEIARYARAAATSLGISADNIESFLVSDVYGLSSRERNAKYLANFAEDIVRMAKAGILMGYTDQKILSAVRTGYKNPYVTSVITKARKKDINIATPSYGRGIFHSAYQNIARNARQMVALAWGRAEQQYGMEHGAIGFRSYRGSSYPCPICDDETTYLHHFGDPFPPYHVNCVCFIKFLYEGDKENPSADSTAPQ